MGRQGLLEPLSSLVSFQTYFRVSQLASSLFRSSAYLQIPTRPTSSAAQWHPLVFLFSFGLMAEFSFLESGTFGIINSLYDMVWIWSWPHQTASGSCGHGLRVQLHLSSHPADMTDFAA